MLHSYALRGAIQGKLLCPLSPARRSRGVHGEQLDAVKTHRAYASAFPQGSDVPWNRQTLFSWKGTHHGHGIPRSCYSLQGVQMDTNDSTWTHTLGTVTPQVYGEGTVADPEQFAMLKQGAEASQQRQDESGKRSNLQR